MWFAAQRSLLEKRLKLWLGQRCVYCEKASLSLLCNQCRSELTPIGLHCQSCAREVAGEHTVCGKCLRESHDIDAMYIAYRYRSPLREIVLKAKFGRDRGALNILQELILQAWPTNIDADLIIPMPIAKSRLVKRGFNQTHMLANGLALYSHIPVDKNILLKKPRQPQSSLTDDMSRQKNIRGAFSATSALYGHVILVDDIITSGATAKEAAKVLKLAGAERVSFICVAAR